jgi:hypothetical protein
MSEALAADITTHPDTYTTPLPVVGEPWFIVRTAPSYMATLTNLAAAAHVRLWSPVYAQRSRVGPNRKHTIKYPPVFPGYAFVPRSHTERLRRVPTFRYQFLRQPSLWDVEFVKLPWRVIHQLALQEVEDCEIEHEEIKAIAYFDVGDWIKTMFGPLQVTGIVGNNLHVEASGKRITIAAAKAQKVA